MSKVVGLGTLADSINVSNGSMSFTMISNPHTHTDDFLVDTVNNGFLAGPVTANNVTVQGHLTILNELNITGDLNITGSLKFLG